MRRRHSHSGSMQGEGGTDWSQPSLLPASIRSKPKPLMEDMPPVEVDPVEKADAKVKEETPAIHMTLSQRYEQETEE